MMVSDRLMLLDGDKNVTGKYVVHVSLESKNSLDLNTVRNNVKMVRF